MADLQRGQGSTMDFLMRMPDLATVDATVTVVGWLKEPGQQVKRGEPLLEVETDKAILPVESPVLGVLCEITAAHGCRGGDRTDDRAIDVWTNNSLRRRAIAQTRRSRHAGFDRSVNSRPLSEKPSVESSSPRTSPVRAQSPGASSGSG